MCMGAVAAYVCVWCLGGQKMASEPLELEFQMVTSCRVNPGTQAPARWTSISAL